MPRYEAFQLIDPTPGYLDFPEWLKDAVATHAVRVTADGEDVHVRTPTGEVHVQPGDWIIRSAALAFFVVSDEVYQTLVPPSSTTSSSTTSSSTTSSTITPSASSPITFEDGLGVPPYSSGVLARSARARAKQAAPDASLEDEAPASPATATANPDNAQIEGVTPDPTPPPS